MLVNHTDQGNSPLLSRRAQNILLVIAFLLPVLAYHRSFSASFVFDDHLLIVKNTAIHSLHNWTQLFSHSMWVFIRNADLFYYRPATLLFFSFEYRLFGDQPMGWHLVSVLLHVIVAGLVFWTGKLVLKDRTAAVFAALLFGVYPLNTEVACWAVAANESLLAIAVLVAFGAFVLWYEQGRNVIWFWVSLACTATALLIKENAVVLPLILFWYAFLRDRGKGQWGQRIMQALLHAVPYALLCVVILFLRAHVLQRSLASQVPVVEMVSRFPGVVSLDLRLLFWPFQLSIFYNPVSTLRIGLAVFLALVISAVFLGGLFWSCRRQPIVSFLLFWTAISLLPSMAIVTAQIQDRFLYLASIAVCWAGGLLIAWAASGSLRLRLGAFAAAAIVVSAFTITSFVASGYWKDDITLIEHGAKVAPQNIVALNVYAGQLLRYGRNHEALAVSQRAMALNPKHWMALYQTGLAELALGDLPGAEEHLSRAEEVLRPGETEILEFTHPLRASIAIRLEDWRKAERLLRESLVVTPDDKRLRDELMYCLQRQMKPAAPRRMNTQAVTEVAE